MVPCRAPGHHPAATTRRRATTAVFHRAQAPLVLISHGRSCLMPNLLMKKRLDDDGMEMDSHGGLEVTIRQTEWKKKTTQQLRGTDL